jgi:hypothetical protein
VSFNGSANIDLPGVNTTGNQNTTGSAATLTTPRAIQGVNFNGSAAITVVTAGTGVTVSGTQVSIGQAVATNSNVQFNSVGVGTAASGTNGQITATGGVRLTSACPFVYTATTVSANTTIPTNFNAMSAGPITINDGVTVTVPDGSVWTIV